MATNREMLKEAIAEAKAVKEMAIANAKAALEEAFTPQLKSMLSMKLQEMEMEEGDIYEYSEEHEDPTTGKRVTASDVTEDDDINEIDLEELLAELEMDEPLNEAEEEEEEGEEEEEEGEEEGGEEGEPLDLEDMTDEDLKKMIEDVIADMVSSGELEAGHEGGEEEEGEEMKMSDEEEVDLAELLREIDEMEDEMEDETVYEEKTTQSLNLEVKETEEELKEAYATIETLKEELNTINLLNAKLLYTNKIFKAKNLNESQKVKVLSSFDRAKNVGEVKMVYETLNEGIKVAKTTIKENLGRASKSTVTPTTKQPIVESNDVFKRMQKLAGII